MSTTMKDINHMLFLRNFHLCVDAREFGSVSRFIRRSCTPNAIARPVYIENILHIGIFALSDLPMNTEVTIGFDQPWKNFKSMVQCTCNSPSCEM